MSNNTLPMGTTFTLGGISMKVVGKKTVKYLVMSDEGGETYMVTEAYILRDGKRIKRA